MRDMSFFWHDYETFGRVPRRDRPASSPACAPMRDLNPIGEPVMLFCQPAPTSCPTLKPACSLASCRSTARRRASRSTSLLRASRAELATPGTVGVGYNSIRFDDEVTRFLFWRNLIDPYAREWQNDCGRWDLLDVMRCAFALRPEGWNGHSRGRAPQLQAGASDRRQRPDARGRARRPGRRARHTTWPAN